MLALTSYEQSNGFSAVTADELFFINGGSSAHPGLEAAGNYLVSVGQNLSGPGEAGSAAGQIAQQAGSTSNWTGLGAAITLGSCIATAAGNVLLFIAHNDSGDVQGAMNNYYEHH